MAAQHEYHRHERPARELRHLTEMPLAALPFNKARGVGLDSLEPMLFLRKDKDQHPWTLPQRMTQTVVSLLLKHYCQGMEPYHLQQIHLRVLEDHQLQLSRPVLFRNPVIESINCSLSLQVCETLFFLKSLGVLRRSVVT